MKNDLQSALEDFQIAYAKYMKSLSFFKSKGGYVDDITVSDLWNRYLKLRKQHKP